MFQERREDSVTIWNEKRKEKREGRNSGMSVMLQVQRNHHSSKEKKYVATKELKGERKKNSALPCFLFCVLFTWVKSSLSLCLVSIITWSASGRGGDGVSGGGYKKQK